MGSWEKAEVEKGGGDLTPRRSAAEPQPEGIKHQDTKAQVVEFRRFLGAPPLPGPLLHSKQWRRGCQGQAMVAGIQMSHCFPRFMSQQDEEKIRAEVFEIDR